MSKVKPLSLILCIILAVLSAVPAFASEADNTRDLLVNRRSELVCVSKYGDTQHYPENTVEGIASAAELGADMVEVSVRKTADGVIVLFSDENLSRMCVDANSSSVDKKISETSFEELSSYHLRNGTGNAHERVTAYTVPSFESALIQLADTEVSLLIEGGWEFRDELYSIIVENGFIDRAVIIADAKKTEVSSWLGSKAEKPLVFSQYKGTVIWNSESYIKNTVSSGVAGVILASGNPYSTTFSATVVKKAASSSRAVIDMTDPKMSGKREDTQLYWDDVTSRGFSVIITDKIEQFILYKQRMELSRKKLTELAEKLENTDLSSCSGSTLVKIETSLAKAEKVLSYSLSAMELEDSYNELYSAFLMLSDGNAKGKGELTVSVGRIIAAVAVISAFLFFELLIERVRNKRVSLRRRGIDKKERYRLKNSEKNGAGK